MSNPLAYNPRSQQEACGSVPTDSELAQAYAQGYQDGRRAALVEFHEEQPMIELTRHMIFACAQDAGQRSMRAAGRTAWARNDWEAACKEYERLSALTNDATIKGFDAATTALAKLAQPQPATKGE